jgi:hypothetical protein
VATDGGGVVGRVAQEFYGLFDGLSLSGDEAWTKGVNLWPLTMCLKSLPGVFGDEDLAQEWCVPHHPSSPPT